MLDALGAEKPVTICKHSLSTQGVQSPVLKPRGNPKVPRGAPLSSVRERPRAPFHSICVPTPLAQATAPRLRGEIPANVW